LSKALEKYGTDVSLKSELHIRLGFGIIPHLYCAFSRQQLSAFQILPVALITVYALPCVHYTTVAFLYNFVHFNHIPFEYPEKPASEALEILARV